MTEIWIDPKLIPVLRKRINRCRKFVSDDYIIKAAEVSKDSVKNIKQGKRIKRVHAEKIDCFLQSQNF